MSGPDDIIVWEWFDEYHRWKPYSVVVSNYLQQNYEKQEDFVPLKYADISLKMYMVDLINKYQERLDTGMKRPITQAVYPSTGAVANGIVWSWETDKPGKYIEYDFQAMELLEEEYKKAKSTKVHLLDMESTSCGLPYIIDFNNMTQTRKETKRMRLIKRDQTTCSYVKVKDTKNPSSVKSGAVPPTSTGGPVLNGAVGGLTNPVTGAFGGATYQAGLGTFGATSQLGASGGAPAPFGSAQSGVPVVGTSYAVTTIATAPTTGATSSTSTDQIPSRVTRSSLKKSKAVSSAVPPDWHPPMALPGSDIKTRGKKSRAKKQKAKPKKKVRPTLLPMGSISNTAKPYEGIVAKKAKVKSLDFNHVVKGYAEMLKKIPKDEECCICMTELSEFSSHNEQCNAVISLKCTHMFHKSCLEAMYNSGTQDGSIQCPQCKTIFGVKYGNCPPGTMEYYKMDRGSLPGYEGCAIIQISYNVPSGIQGKEHPNPGQRYVAQGFPRIGFLPDNEDGQRILRLLIKAWERRLTFTVATSVTTGLKNAVVWNEIHHKTEIIDHSGHGYPDPKYFDNVTLELASQGVIDSGESSSSSEAEEFSSDEDL